MSRLEAAKAWYDQQVAWLSALDSWIRAGKKQPDDPALRGAVLEYVALKNKEARDKLKTEREDVQRVALIRLFAGFEADFRGKFATFLARRNAGAQAGHVEKALPDSIELVLLLAQSLEPRFSGSLKGWLDGLRGFRNDVMHKGFEEVVVKYDPAQAYEKLREILDMFAPPAAPT